MELGKACRNDDIICIADELLARWERTQAFAVPGEPESLEHLLPERDGDSDD